MRLENPTADLLYRAVADARRMPEVMRVLREAREEMGSARLCHESAREAARMFPEEPATERELRLAAGDALLDAARLYSDAGLHRTAAGVRKAAAGEYARAREVAA